MTLDSILAEIDAEIARLTEARKLLASAGSTSSTRSASSRRTATKSAATKGRKRVLSPDARKRIADAQRRRWAAQKSKSKKETKKEA